MIKSSDIQIVIWGIGYQADQTYMILKKFQIIFAIDSNEKLQKKLWHDIPIISFEEYLKKNKNYIIVITPQNNENIILSLKKNNYDNFVLLNEIFPFIPNKTLNNFNNKKTMEQLIFINQAMFYLYDEYDKIVKKLYEGCFFDSLIDSKDKIINKLKESKNPYIESNLDVILEPLTVIRNNPIKKIKSDYLPKDADLYIVHGLHLDFDGIYLSLEAKKRHIPIIFEEDGFLYSIEPHNGSCPNRFKTRCSIIMDNQGVYFNAHSPSIIESILNSSRLFTDEEINRSKDCISLLCENKISKYNHQPIIDLNINNIKKNILIIDQVHGDKSIEYGMATEETFKKMLETAINENPDAEIYIKSHPVKNKGHFNNINKTENIHFIDYGVNPFSLLEKMNKVYVCTSQLGFEALMCGKEVHVFGMPFYAGWGVTIDYQQCKRRNKNRSVEEIFYVVYIICSTYVSVQKKRVCEVEEIIEELIDLRKDYLNLL